MHTHLVHKCIRTHAFIHTHTHTHIHGASATCVHAIHMNANTSVGSLSLQPPIKSLDGLYCEVIVLRERWRAAYVHLHMRMCVCTCMYMHVCMHMGFHIYIYIYIYYTCICMYVCICVCMHVRQRVHTRTGFRCKQYSEVPAQVHTCTYMRIRDACVATQTVQQGYRQFFTVCGLGSLLWQGPAASFLAAIYLARHLAPTFHLRTPPVHQSQIQRPHIQRVKMIRNFSGNGEGCVMPRNGGSLRAACERRGCVIAAVSQPTLIRQHRTHDASAPDQSTVSWPPRRSAYLPSLIAGYLTSPSPSAQMSSNVMVSPGTSAV
jgi:hypothetical protein